MMKEEDTPIAILRNKLDASLERNCSLEKENEQLRQEVHHIKTQLALLRGQDDDRRSMLWKKLHGSIGGNNSSQEKQMVHGNGAGEDLGGSNSCSKQELSRPPAMTTISPRVPKPPPNPACLPPTPDMRKETWLPPPPNPTRLPPTPNMHKETWLPPPPPPLPFKSPGGSVKAIRRVPELVELYRSLTRKEGKADTKAGSLATPSAANAREMIGEIENRSAYLLAIKTDVENQGKFINFLAKEVENAAHKEIADAEAFVKWLDEELSYLVDERAVLKHFPQWPEKKADAMREAACGYRDLKNLESEASTFQDDKRLPTTIALKHIQTLQDKLEHSVHNLERVRDTAIRRYRDFKIPWEWMLDTGIITQLKLGSMKLARGYMTRVVTAAKTGSLPDDEELTLQGVRFAFRVHQERGPFQFVGGLDEDGRRAFLELKKLASKS